MQPRVPTGDRNPNNHTEATILDAIRGNHGSRRWSFRYELLDSANTYIQDLSSVQWCEIEQNWLADIKRVANFTIRDTGEIDYLSDRIKPYVRLHIPPYAEDDWVEWPQGVFLLSSPQRMVDAAGTVKRTVEAYDALKVFIDDKVADRYTVAIGTNVVTAVTTLLGSVPSIIAPHTATLAVAKDWEPGTTKLEIINELLTTINYESLSIDEDGLAIVQPYRSPQDRSEEYVYADDQDSIMLPDVEQTLDLFTIPNKWVLVVSDPDRSAIIGTYTNDDPSSPTSTVNRQRTIVDFRTEQDAVDSTHLNALAARLGFEASQVFEAIDFYTGLNPLHSGNDVYRLTYSPLAIDSKYSEHSWSMSLEPVTVMKHRARRVVSV